MGERSQDKRIGTGEESERLSVVYMHCTCIFVLQKNKLEGMINELKAKCQKEKEEVLRD